MAAPTSTNEVTVRRLSSVITQLWAKIQDTFAPKSHTHSLLKFGNKTYNGSSEQTITASDLGAYQKPSSGIPKSDLASGVIPTSLPANGGNADNAKNVSCIKNMYFNTATYALDIKIPNVRTAGTTFLIQMCQNNGNVCVLELSLWKSKDSAITGRSAVLLYCSDYGVSQLPKDVFCSTSATGDNHVYLASNSTSDFSTSFSILYNSMEIAEDRMSSITFGTVERATARGQAQLTVRASGIPRVSGTAVGSSSEPVYVDPNGLLTACGDLNAATATNAEGLTRNGYGRFRYLSHSGSNALVIELGAVSNYASILICSSRDTSPVVFCISFNWSGSSWTSIPKTAYLYTTDHSYNKYSPIVKYSTNSGKIYIYYSTGSETARLFYSYQGSNAESVSYDVISKADIPSSGISESAYEANVSKDKVGTAIGSTSTPVYVQASGFVAPCSSVEATTLKETLGSKKSIYAEYSATDVSEVTPDGDSSRSNSKWLAVWETTTHSGDATLNAVDAGNVTVANSVKWNGYKIDTSGTIGSDTSTIYFA